MRATVHIQSEREDGEPVQEVFEAHRIVIGYRRKGVDDPPILQIGLCGPDGNYLLEEGANDQVKRPRIYKFPATRTHVVVDPK